MDVWVVQKSKGSRAHALRSRERLVSRGLGILGERSLHLI